MSCSLLAALDGPTRSEWLAPPDAKRTILRNDLRDEHYHGHATRDLDDGGMLLDHGIERVDVERARCHRLHIGGAKHALHRGQQKRILREPKLSAVPVVHANRISVRDWVALNFLISCTCEAELRLVFDMTVSRGFLVDSNPRSPMEQRSPDGLVWIRF